LHDLSADPTRSTSRLGAGSSLRPKREPPSLDADEGIMKAGRFGCQSLGPGTTFVLSLTWFTVACSTPQETAPEVVRPVKTMVVAPENEPQARSFPGKVEASSKVELAFQVPGVLIRLPVKEGQRVSKGAVVAQIRQDEYQARLETAQGERDRAQATLAALRQGERPEEQLRLQALERAAAAKLDNAKADLDRYGRLVQSSAVSRSEYELASTAYRVAEEDHTAAVQLLEKATTARKEDIEAQEATVRGLDGRVADAELQLRDSAIRAPYDGVIAQRLVDEGQTITPGKPVVRFQSVGEVDIVVDVPEAIMTSNLHSGAIVGMQAEITGAPGRRYRVRIKEIAQVADPTTQTFPVRFAMSSPSGVTILPGMTATVGITYRRPGVQGNRILAPISAVCKQDNGAQVAWLIGPNQIATPRPVRIGAVTDGEIEIREGLKPGDRIAVAGAAFLRDGMKVRDLGNALGGEQQ
jgi:membrane fusion protein, multidrug efflux system